MSTPYHYTPRVPAPPHPTPLSVSAYTFSNSKAGRPPIQNPYDKFTQPEFDVWIGGITGALKRALGQEETSKEQEKRAEADLGSPNYRYLQFGTGESDDEPADDSFAEVKARRAKGKARDPREGPGFGKGDSKQPIEIVSSDEEDAQEVELAIADEVSDSEDDEEQEQEESEEEYAWERGQSSSQPLPSPRSRKQVEEYDDEEEYDTGDEVNDEGGEYGGEEGSECDREAIGDHEEWDEEQYDDNEEEDPSQPVEATSDEVIEIISDDDDELINSAPQVGDDRGQQEVEDYPDEYEEYDEDDDQDTELGTSNLIYSDIIRRPRDDDEGEHDGDLFGDDDEIEEMQPTDDDTSFPLQTSLVPNDSQQPVEIRDPWSGPRTYAEDFYSGGDLGLPPGARIDVHNLGPADMGSLQCLDEADQVLVEDIEVIQPMGKDISYPPASEETNDTEDLYSGDAPLPMGSVHDLGVDIEELRADVVEVHDSDDVKPLDEDISFPSEVKEFESPVDLSDPYIGPQTYAEDFYSGGDLRPTTDHQFGPSMLLNTDGVEDDIDHFLTPGVLTPNTSSDRVSLAEDIREDEGEEQAIQLPQSQHTSVSWHHKHIPVDADFIDDSYNRQENVAIQPEEDGIFEDDEDMTLMYPESDELHPEVDVTDDGIQGLQKDEYEEFNYLLYNDITSLDAPLVHGIGTDSPANPVAEKQEEVLFADENLPSEIDLPIINDELKQQEASLDSLAEVIEPESASECSPEEDGEHAAKVVTEFKVQAMASVENVSEHNFSTVIDDEVDACEIIVGTGEVEEDVVAEEVVTSAEESMNLEVQNITEIIVEAHQEPFVAASDNQEPEAIASNPDRPNVFGDAVQQTPNYRHAPSLTALSQVQLHDQLPTPPSEKGLYISLPQVVEDTSTGESPSVELQMEVQDNLTEAASPPHPQPTNMGNADIELVTSTSMSFEYSVEEIESCTDEDAEGEFDDADDHDDMPMVSLKNSVDIPDRLSGEKEEFSIFEEPTTEGRLTEEPTDRETSLGVLSLSHEEATAFYESCKEDVQAAQISPAREEVSTGDTADSDTGPFISVVVVDHNTSPSNQRIPRPVTADASVHDPMDRFPDPSFPPPDLLDEPVTPSLFTPVQVLTPNPNEEGTLATFLGPQGRSPSVISRTLTQADGLFTPTESSTNTVIVEGPDDLHNHLLTSLADAISGPGTSPDLSREQIGFSEAMSSAPNDSLTSAQRTSPRTLPDSPPPLKVGNSSTTTDIVEDVFGGANATSYTNNSIPSSSDTSIVPKESEGKGYSSLDDVDALGPQYPPDHALVKDVEEHGFRPGDDNTSKTTLAVSSVVQTSKTLIAPNSSPVKTYGRTQLEQPSVLDSIDPEPIIQVAEIEAGSSKQGGKRKRDSSPKLETPAKSQKWKGRKSAKRKSASKHDIPEPLGDEIILVKPRPKINTPVDRATSEASQASRASSRASIANKILKPTSRSSSIASATPSIASQPSPTINKPIIFPSQTLAPPVSLLHAHGQKRKLLARQLSQTVMQHPQPPMPQPPRLPSVALIPEKPSVPSPPPTTSVVAPTVPHIIAEEQKINTALSIKDPQSPFPQIPNSSAASSPVTRSTRSHCRYHRISLPKEEGGPRVCFLVPGCSLNDKGLMEEEEIEDHGDATQEDSQRMVKDVEALGFDLALIGVLRQLVGLDILREQEVFYLPRPGEEVQVYRRNSSRKSITDRSGIVRGPGESSSYAGSPARSIKSPGSNRPPPSVADSTSTTFSAIRNAVNSEKGSTIGSTDTEADPSDDDEPNAKRTKSSPGEQGVMGPPTTQSKSKKLKARRSKKLDHAYQPEDEPEEASDDGQLSLRKRRKTRRGMKRPRTSDFVAEGTDGTERQSKKLKLYMSVPEPPTLHQQSMT